MSRKRIKKGRRTRWQSEVVHESCGYTWIVPAAAYGRLSMCPGCGSGLPRDLLRQARPIIHDHVRQVIARRAAK